MVHMLSESGSFLLFVSAPKERSRERPMGCLVCEGECGCSIDVSLALVEMLLGSEEDAILEQPRKSMFEPSVESASTLVTVECSILKVFTQA